MKEMRKASSVFVSVFLCMMILAAFVMPVMAAERLIAPAPEAAPAAGHVGTYDLVIGGKDSGIKAAVYVPVRTVAEALGYTVEWDAVEKAVILDNGVMHTKFWVGVDSYQVTASGEETVGMSAPFTLGMPPVVAKGVSYVPVALFEALEGNMEGMFSIENGKVVIAKEEKPEAPEVPVMGGWIVADDMDITEEIKAMFEKAAAGKLGVDYVPVAVLGRQVVAGTNWCILARKNVVVPDEPTCYALVTVYEDLEGNASITEVKNVEPANLVDKSADPASLFIDEAFVRLPGSWTPVQDVTVTDELKDLFTKALGGLVGADHQPVLLLETQVVSGVNYCFLCKSTPVYPGAQAHYTLVFVNNDAAGNASLLNIADLDLGVFND